MREDGGFDRVRASVYLMQADAGPIERKEPGRKVKEEIKAKRSHNLVIKRAE